jgi:endonuclease/exonuclease/phosphatase family metal-dependent hydrolase
LPPDAGVPVVDWKDAGQYVDKSVIVQGKIVATRNIGRICFLNFDTARSFVVIVREGSYPNFPEPPEQMYDQKIVRVRGLVSEYNGKPQIEATHPDQITLLDEEKPLAPAGKPPARSFSGTVKIATFNVLNLFDEYDDPYHDDETTPAKPREQLEKIAATIHAVDADVVALEEVENRGYLTRFVAAMLPDMGYQEIVCFEGNDHRGIDCAVLSRFPVGPVTSYRHLHFTDGSGGETQFQRDFLQVQIQPPGGPSFCVFPVHFKSKRGGGEATEKIRVGETREARRILDELLKRQKDALFVVCGDFNDTWDSAPLKTIRGEGAAALRGFVQDLPKDARTYNVGEHSDMIDYILASPAMAARYVQNSYKIIGGDVESVGSDHNAVVAQFKLK